MGEMTYICGEAFKGDSFLDCASTSDTAPHHILSYLILFHFITSHFISSYSALISLIETQSDATQIMESYLSLKLLPFPSIDCPIYAIDVIARDTHTYQSCSSLHRSWFCISHRCCLLLIFPSLSL